MIFTGKYGCCGQLSVQLQLDEFYIGTRPGFLSDNEQPRLEATLYVRVVGQKENIHLSKTYCVLHPGPGESILFFLGALPLLAETGSTFSVPSRFLFSLSIAS